jgi:predicted DNA-binding transcriptional regulator AlpA
MRGAAKKYVTVDGMTDRIIGVAELGTLIGRTTGSIRTAVWRMQKYPGSAGAVPAPSKCGGRLLWLESDVRRWLEANRLGGGGK